MSKAHHRQHHSPAPGRIVSEGLWDRLPYKAVIFSFVLAAIPFAAGKYIEFNTPGAFDSGAYMYSAKRVLNGAIPWVNEGVTAKAGTLLVNMLGIALFGYNDYSVKTIQMVLQIAALVSMFFVIRKIFGGLAAGVALVVASFYLSAPLIAKYGNVKEQYMIVFMMLGVSMLLMRQMGGAWWWGLLAGGFLAWGPMFKETGISAIIATFVFLSLQPLLKNRSWKLTGADFVLVILGGILAIAPVHLWIKHIGAPALFNPYVLTARYSINTAYGLVVHKKPPPAPKAAQDGNKPAAAPAPKSRSSDYLEGSRELITLKEQFPRIFRWYFVLILPVSLALGSIVLRLVRAVMAIFHKLKPGSTKPYECLVFLLGLWWLIDMTLVWASPRPWEEYYLPLCASGAMASSYLVAIYRDKLRAASEKAAWILFGVAGLVCMVVMAWNIIFGLHTSPHSGGRYDTPSNGYVQRLEEIHGTAQWEEVAHYIEKNSGPQDKIYVWGWYPGIYVESRRDSASASLPFTSEAHVVSPQALATQVKDLVASFEREKPKFLVDTRKPDTPFTYPPLEFWPYWPGGGFIPNDPAAVAAYETQWRQWLRQEITGAMTPTKGPAKAAELAGDEVLRFDAMKPLRDYAMANYHIVSPETYRPIQSISLTAGRFGIHVLLVRNDAVK